MDAYRISCEERTNVTASNKIPPNKRPSVNDLIDAFRRRFSSQQPADKNVDENAWKSTALKSDVAGATLGRDLIGSRFYVAVADYY